MLVHIPHIRAQPQARIVGITDTGAERAQELAMRFYFPHVYPTLTDLLDAQRPAVVYILTLLQTHAALAMEAMQAEGSL